MPLTDYLSAQGMEIVAVDSQGFARAGELQLIDQEDLEEIHYDFPTAGSTRHALGQPSTSR